MSKVTSLFKPKNLSGPLVFCIGLAISLYGFQNMYARQQQFFSPFDKVTHTESSERLLGEPARQEAGSLPTNNYLPLIQPAGLAGRQLAPELNYSIGDRGDDDEGENFELLGIKFSEKDGRIPSFAVKDAKAQKPSRLVIPAISVDAPVVPVSYQEVEYQGETFLQWGAPREDAVGWHDTSALLGLDGNTVLNGHSSGYTDVFEDLEEVNTGDLIHVLSGEYDFVYVVTNVMILKERFETTETRIGNASWINTSEDERLTLISCWPPGSNTHRVVIVAVPVEREK